MNYQGILSVCACAVFGFHVDFSLDACAHAELCVQRESLCMFSVDSGAVLRCVESRHMHQHRSGEWWPPKCEAIRTGFHHLFHGVGYIHLLVEKV